MSPRLITSRPKRTGCAVVRSLRVGLAVVLVVVEVEVVVVDAAAVVVELGSGVVPVVAACGSLVVCWL